MAIFLFSFFWLPNNLTWKDLQTNDVVQYPRFSDIFVVAAMSVAIGAISNLLQRCVFLPLGLSLGLQPKISGAIDQLTLEQAFQNNHSWSRIQTKKLSKEIGWDVQQVKRWLHRRKKNETPQEIEKFAESGWKMTYHSCMCVLGLAVLWDKPWLWDVEYCWLDYPHHNITWSLRVYYAVALSYFISMIRSDTYKKYRKDYVQRLVHHVAAISLIFISWVVNFVRIGSLVLLIHDWADVFLDLSKMTNYLKWRHICNIFFAIFTIVWCVTRLVIFSILICSFWNAPVRHLIVFPVYNVLLFLKLTLLLLHLLWTYSILKVLQRFLFTNEKLKDALSDSDDDYSQNRPITKSIKDVKRQKH